jgi:hypothetical protein
LARGFAAQIGTVRDEAVAARFDRNLKTFAQRPGSGLFTLLINDPDGGGIASVEQTQNRVHARSVGPDGRPRDDYRDEFILHLKTPQTIRYIDTDPESGKRSEAGETVQTVVLHVHYASEDATRFEACHFKIQPQRTTPGAAAYRSDDDRETMATVLKTVSGLAVAA